MTKKEATRDPSPPEFGKGDAGATMKMKEPEVGLDDDHTATGPLHLGRVGGDDAPHDDDLEDTISAAATRRRVPEAVDHADPEFGDVEAAGADQAARERPRLSAYGRVVAYLAADSCRRLVAYVRGNSAFRAATGPFEPCITAPVDTLGAATCVAAAAAWAGLGDAPAQARRGARLVVRLVTDASRRLVAFVVGNPAFRAAAPFLPPGTAELAGALWAAAYLATAAARAGLHAFVAQPRRWARRSLRFLLVAAAAYSVVDTFACNPVLVSVSVFGVPGFLQLCCVLAAIAYAD